MREQYLDDMCWENVSISRSNNEIWWELCVEGNPYPQWVPKEIALGDLSLSNFDCVPWVM